MYFKNYFNSVKEGLDKTLYYIDSNISNPNDFFCEIKKIHKHLLQRKNKIFFFGNGASSAFANHMALDFSKNGKIISKSLSDSALSTALSNDFSFEEAMVEFLKIEDVTNEDFVVTISSSGNSPNVLSVLDYCKKNGIKTLSLSGLKNNNKSISSANYSIYVPMKTYGMVECIHQIFLHLILDDFMEIREWDMTHFQNMNNKDFKL